MLLKSTRYIWASIGVVIQGYTLFGWLTDSVSILGYSPNPADWAALSTAGLCILIGVIPYRAIAKARPRERFHRLHPQIMQLISELDSRDMLEMFIAKPIPSRIYAMSTDLMMELEKLKIPYPNPPKQTPSPWIRWLPRLYAFLKIKDLRGVRNDEATWKKYFQHDDL